MPQSAMIIAPHPDDEAIGCGGAILLHRQRGERVKIVFLTSGERGIQGVSTPEALAIRETEARRAADILAVADLAFLRLPDQGVHDNIAAATRQLGQILAAARPNFIYLPHPAEAHPDHQASLPLVRGALAKARTMAAPGAAPPSPELRLYEVWTPMEQYDWPEDITAVMARKIAAIRCYTSQLVAFRYDRAIRGLSERARITPHFGAAHGPLGYGCGWMV